MLRLIGIFAFAFISCSAFAQTESSIGNIGGNFYQGGTASISGTGFGTKSTAKPVRYDDFNSGNVEQRLKSQDEDGWFTMDSNGIFPKYSNEKERVPEGMVALQDFRVATNQAIGLKGLHPTQTLYVSGWTYRQDISGTTRNSESVRFGGTFSSSQGKSGRYPENDMVSNWVTERGRLVARADQGQESGSPWFKEDPHLNEWIRVERYVSLGDPGAPNGISWIAQNFQEVGRIEGVFWNGGIPFDTWLIGQYFQKPDPGQPEASVKVYWDELYVDVTQARVEIGNYPNFEECTHREIQIPQTWTDENITFLVNYGTLSPEEDLWLFVVNGEGLASEGFKKEPGVPGTPVPGKPGQPRVVENQ